MDRPHSITPAEVLKAIRDGSAVDHPTLDKILAGCDGDRYLIRQAIGSLQEANLIKFEQGRFTVTDHWMALQGLLGISLTSLIESKPGLQFLPFFGMPRGFTNVPDIFVLMSFESKLEPIYREHILNVAKRLKLRAKRADDFFTAHSVVEDIWAAIYRAKIIIADCTGRNANVFYEIGIAHTAGKRVILITQNERDVPFDLRPIRYIRYSYTPPGMRILEEKLEKTINEELKSVTPVTLKQGTIDRKATKRQKAPLIRRATRGSN